MELIAFTFLFFFSLLLFETFEAFTFKMWTVQGFPANRWQNKMGVMLSLGLQLIIQLLYQIPHMFEIY